MAAKLTAQDRAMFAPVDRYVPGSSLTEYAESMCERVEAEVKARLAHGLFPPILDQLVELRGEFEDGHHHSLEGHDNSTVHAETCLACRVQVIIDSIMEALL